MFHHTASKRIKISFKTTRQTLSAHMNRHHIRQIWIRYIIQFGIPCKNLSMKEGVNRLRTSKIFGLLS